MMPLTMSASQRRVLQLCHSHGAPFADITQQWARLFADTGWNVTTVYLTGNPDDEVMRASGGDKVIFFGFDSRDVRGLKLRAVWKLRQLQRANGFVLAVAHRFKPVYTCCLALDVPVIGVHHAYGDYRRLGRRLFASAFASRLALAGVSDAVRDDIRECLPNWPADRILTQYNHIDLAKLQADLVARDEARRVLGLPDAAYIFGNVGRLHPDKDQATLIRAFARLAPHGSLLAIAGRGGLEESLKALARELGIAERVRFLGQTPSMSRYFRAFDSFVLSSDHEPFGMVLLEAMAAEIPVIASDCGGAREVVAAREWRFPLGAAEVLAERMHSVRELGPGQRADLTAAQLTHLQAHFSQAAAQRQFWAQPSVQAWAGRLGTT
jgi:glycosyltransferase involved in cell wall biosynthesis